MSISLEYKIKKSYKITLLRLLIQVAFIFDDKKITITCLCYCLGMVWAELNYIFNEKKLNGFLF